MTSSTNTKMNPVSVVRHSQKGFHIDLSSPPPLSCFAPWLHVSAMIVGALTLVTCSVESSPSALAGFGVTDHVKRSLDDIAAAERGLARPIPFVDS